MTESNEPVRWRDDPQSVPNELAESLPCYAKLGPSAELQARMFEAIEQGLLAACVTDAAVAVDRGLRASWKLKLVLGGALALVLIGSYALQGGRATRDAAERPQSDQTIPNVVADAPPETLTTQFVPSDAETPVVAEAKVAPSKVAPSNVVQRVRKAHAARPSEPAVLDPQAELSLLSRAQRVLAGSPSRALELTREHEEKFERGMFVQEREVIAIEALVKLGRSSEARARAASFEREYQRSTYLERIHVILSTP